MSTHVPKTIAHLASILHQIIALRIDALLTIVKTPVKVPVIMELLTQTVYTVMNIPVPKPAVLLKDLPHQTIVHITNTNKSFE